MAGGNSPLLQCFMGVKRVLIQTSLRFGPIYDCSAGCRAEEAQQVVFGILCQMKRLHFFLFLDGKLASLRFSAFSLAVLVEPLLC